jgi:DNA invertase Pin-like site-specific DNA recombinase
MDISKLIDTEDESSLSNTSEISKKVAIYCRVSSERQYFDGVGLDFQLKICNDYCDQKGYKVVYVIKEIASAKNMDDQKSLNALACCEMADKPDILLVYNISRFSRNVVQGISMYNKLKEKKIELQSVMENLTSPATLAGIDSSPNGTSSATASTNFILISLLNNSEYELKLISQRTKHAIKLKREKGHRFGRVPYGMKDVRDQDNIRTFENDEYESNVLRFIRMARKNCSLADLNGILKQISNNAKFKPLELDDYEDEIKTGLTGRNIAEILNDYEITYRGKKWTHGNVLAVSNK